MSASVILKGVRQWYGDLEALSLINLVVRPSETLTLLGPSGCGKTTLLHIVAGLTQPTAGSASIDELSPAEARRGGRIGLVPQTPALLPWRNVRQNARLLLDVGRTTSERKKGNGHPSSAGAMIDELLAEVGLADFYDALPHELSGGMQQRVALVRAFALGASLLLMDEPFAALDELTRAEMRHLLARLRTHTDATVLFVTHSLEEAAFLSDRVVVMTARPGRIHEIIPIDLSHRNAEIERELAFFETINELRRSLGVAVEMGP